VIVEIKGFVCFEGQRGGKRVGRLTAANFLLKWARVLYLGREKLVVLVGGGGKRGGVPWWFGHQHQMFNMDHTWGLGKKKCAEAKGS